ncbi:MAG: prephenate dehydrogenase [Anaerolineae bacterium]
MAAPPRETSAGREAAPDDIPFTRVAIVGMGLMGGSLGLALKARSPRTTVVGVARRRSVVDLALQMGAADEATTDLAEGVGQADLVVLSTPVRTLIRQIPEVAGSMQPGAVLTDMGSTKAAIMRAMAQAPWSIQPVGGHPMCGKEVAGLEVAEATLYDGATWPLTPLERTDPAATAGMRALVQAVGARPIMIEPDRHDRLVAAISHLPYLLAVALTGVVDEVGEQDELVWALAASGFRDTSRVAASDLAMMLDILATNRRYVAAMAGRFHRRLGQLIVALEAGDDAETTDLRPRLEAAQEKRIWWGEWKAALQRAALEAARSQAGGESA